MRRAGHRGDDPGAAIGVPLPVGLEAMEAELPGLERELQQLDDRRRQLGHRFSPDDERRLSFVRGRAGILRGQIAQLRRAQGGNQNG
jgi:hypothetical protein